MTQILAINGSYRDDGITDQALAVAVQTLQIGGAEVDTIVLRQQDIGFCTNCRECMQEPGATPGRCVLHDSMRDVIDRIEAADGYVIAVPTNLGSATAVFKRFMERLAVYAYWPWGAPGPKYRKATEPRKKALLITSSAAPGLFGRLLYGTRRQLKMVAGVLGAQAIGTVSTGVIADQPRRRLPDRARRRTERLARKLISTSL